MDSNNLSFGGEQCTSSQLPIDELVLSNWTPQNIIPLTKPYVHSQRAFCTTENPRFERGFRKAHRYKSIRTSYLV